MEELIRIEELSKPLLKHLQKYYNPHTSIIIDCDRIRVVEDLLSIPFSYEGREEKVNGNK